MKVWDWELAYDVAADIEYPTRSAHLIEPNSMFYDKNPTGEYTDVDVLILSAASVLSLVEAATGSEIWHWV